ncbi:MAG TPA: hypothetical protein VKT72_06770 [Candidatus Baltobacteraceae bacterium]|nr:hypothetical protein [Candidatus Baltobacteraceae bacterium]
MNRWLPFVLFPILLAAGPAPLIVGSVRDQFGAAVFGARISAGTQSTLTDARGTFALAASDAGYVRINCDYCDAITVPVKPGEPVVALVHRYDALASGSPTERDLAFVPYDRAESIAALRPFMVLENSSQVRPGAQLSDHGGASRGMLVQAGGIPIYDVTSNQSPFVFFPSYDVEQIDQHAPSDAFQYGDLAGGGTLQLDTRTPGAWNGVSLGGSGNAFAAAQTFPGVSWSAATSNTGGDLRTRADAGASATAGDDTFDLRGFTSQDRNSLEAQQLNANEGGFGLFYTSTRANRVDASLTSDSGGYDGSAQGYGYSARWSDIEAQAGVTTQTPVQFFVSTALRNSSGLYSSAAPGDVPLTAAVITQTRVDAGMQTAGDRYQLRLGIGAFEMQYSGGSAAHQGLYGGTIAPGFTGSYEFDPHWTYDLQAGQSFTLPTILEAFASPPDTPALAFDRYTQITQTLEYSDLRRFRAAVTDMSESISGLDVGTVHSPGVSVAWQLAPALSLRAWLLRDNDQTQPYEPLYRFGVPVEPSTVGSYWLTYESAGVRIDAIYRRDLLDSNPDPHFDASISAPVSGQLRIFGATERIAGRRLFSIGLRAQPH